MNTRPRFLFLIALITLVSGCVHQRYENFPIRPPKPPKQPPPTYVDPSVQSATPQSNASTCALISGSEIRICGPNPSDPEFIKKRNPGLPPAQAVDGERVQHQVPVNRLTSHDEKFLCTLLDEIERVPSIGGFDLQVFLNHDKAQVILSTKSKFFIFPGEIDASQIASSIDCDGVGPFMTVTVHPQTIASESEPRYCFLYRLDSFCPNQFLQFQNDKNNILVVSTPYDIDDFFESERHGDDISKIEEFNEVARTIIHESFHLYAQISVSQADAQVGFPLVAETDSRSAINSLYASDKRYNDSVRAEFCSIASLLNFSDRSAGRWRKIINAILHEMETRDRLFDSLEAERFWYFLEGIPMYLEQQLTVDDHRRFIGTINLVCDGQSKVFYPLYSGAVLAFALDNLENRRSCEGWRKNISLDQAGVAKWFKFIKGCVST